MSLRDLSHEVQAALKLLDSETADELVGEAGQSDEYGALVRGARAVMAMNWAAARSAGMRESPASLRYGAQTLSIVLTLVHYAYALGSRRGREDITRVIAEPNDG